jgi:hypothetical protein
MYAMKKNWLHQPQMHSPARQGSQGNRLYKTAPLGWQEGMQHTNSHSFYTCTQELQMTYFILLLQPAPNPARWRCWSHPCCLTKEDCAKKEPTKETKAKETKNQLITKLKCYLCYCDCEIVSRPMLLFLRHVSGPMLLYLDNNLDQCF